LATSRRQAQEELRNDAERIKRWHAARGRGQHGELIMDTSFTTAICGARTHQALRARPRQRGQTAMPTAWRRSRLRRTEGNQNALKHGLTTKEQWERLKYANRFWRDARRRVVAKVEWHPGEL